MTNPTALRVLIAGLCLLTTGCGPKVSDDDLGVIEIRVPAVPGTATPYPFHQLEEPKEID